MTYLTDAEIADAAIRGIRADAAAEAAELLDQVHAFLCRFVAFPSTHAQVAVTLWVTHTHMADRFDSTPRLALLSPEKQSGKTRTLELVELLCAGAEFLTDASASFVFRLVGAGRVTVLLDECDTIWTKKGGDETAEALRGIVNSGHRKGATVGRVEMVGQRAELRRFPVYAPVALAGIGNLPDTILDRSVIVRMRRRAPDEDVEPYRARTGRPEGEALRERLAEWAESVANKVGCPWPDMPKGVADRPADVWEPLLMVADLAGGDWPDRAGAACVAFVTGSQDDTASLGVRLLADIRTVWPGSGTSGTSGTPLVRHVPHVPDVPHLGTEDLLTRLHALDEAPWGDWYGHPLNSRDLAKLLKPYGVKSTKVRIGDTTPRGYIRADLAEQWKRYLPATPPVSATSATCQACGEPMTAVEPGQTTHPGCEPDETCRHCGPAASVNRLTSMRGQTITCAACGRSFIAGATQPEETP